MGETPAADRLSELAIDRSPRRRARHPLRNLALGVGALLLAVLVAIALINRAPTVAVAQVREAAPGEAVTVLTAAGYVAADRRSVVAPKAPGRLDKVEVAEGDRVSQGEIIARMDPEDTQIAQRQAGAAVDAARASLGASRAQAIQAQRALDRSVKLAAGGAITGEALLDAKAARDTARAQQAAAAARLEESKRALQAAQQRLEDTVIRAPFTGTVAKKLADEGAVLAPAAISEKNMGGILELVDLDSLYVEGEVSEDQLGRVETGRPALIFLDAFPGRTYRAKTGTVRPVIDKAKATAVIRVEFEQLPEGPLPDMGAKVSFLEKAVSEEDLEAEPRLRVPATAVVERDGKAVVMAVRGGRVEEVPVRVARRVGTEDALAKGPEPGTTVVAAPGSRLRHGSRVKVRAEAS